MIENGLCLANYYLLQTTDRLINKHTEAANSELESCGWCKCAVSKWFIECGECALIAVDEILDGPVAKLNICHWVFGLGS